MGSVAHQITLGRHRIEILMSRVKRTGFLLERDSHPDQRAECLPSPQSSRMSPSARGPKNDLGVFGLDKRTEAVDESNNGNAAADEVSSGNAVGDDIVPTGWLVKDCGAHSVRAIQLFHRTTQGGKQGRGRWFGVVILFTSDATSMCVAADQSTCLYGRDSGYFSRARLKCSFTVV